MTLPPFEDVVAEHGPTVWRVCRALLGPADAEDAWSDTFVAALRAYPSLPPDSHVSGWLVTIAHRKALDQLRRAGRAPEPMPEVPEPSATVRRHAAPGDLPGDVTEPFDEQPRSALAALGPKQRAAVVYHHVAGLPYAEVGALLATSEAAARRSAADGIATLRKLVRKDPS